MKHTFELKAWHPVKNTFKFTKYLNKYLLIVIVFLVIPAVLAVVYTVKVAIKRPIQTSIHIKLRNIHKCKKIEVKFYMKCSG